MTWTAIPVTEGTELEIWLERPAPPPSAAVIVLHELGGVNAHIRDVTRRIADAGYVAVAPDLFHRSARRFEGPDDDPAPGLAHARALVPEGVVADLRAVHEWLATDRVAVWGFCMGGRIAHRANVALPLRASIAFYGGGLPDTPLRGELDQLHGATLLVWGGRDPHVTAAQRRELADAIAAAGRPYVDAVFGDADHGFFCDTRAAYHAPSAHQAWALACAFLEEHLR
jgi:carboxymethylenebutenolidase